MKIRKLLFSFLGIVLSCICLSGCVFKALEKEINVVFVSDGEIIASDTVTQFKNIKTPEYNETLESGYRFLGWTPYTYFELEKTDPEVFKTQYIKDGRMVHYRDVVDFADNSTVTLESLVMKKEDIPKVYHYAVIAWYDKETTSGLTSELMATFEEQTKLYLLDEGVSQEDIDTIVFRGYTGNVGQSTGQIVYDDDVDIMIGWGGNVTTTGSIPQDWIVRSFSTSVLYQGSAKIRTSYIINASEGALKVVEFMEGEEGKAIFNPQG